MRKKLVYLDIETIPQVVTPERMMVLAAMAAPKTTDDPQQWAEKHWRDVHQSWSLEPLRGHVCCIGIGWHHDGGEMELHTIGPHGGTPADNERRVLSELATRIETMAERHSAQPYWVGHNIKGFDLPFLRSRAIILGGPQAVSSSTRMRSRWGTSDCYDTMEEWPTVNYRGRTSSKGNLADVSVALGMAEPEGSGADVLGWWLAGDYVAIATHAADDVVRVTRVYAALEGGGDGSA